jgi:hypothetical protein
MHWEQQQVQKRAKERAEAEVKAAQKQQEKQKLVAAISQLRQRFEEKQHSMLSLLVHPVLFAVIEFLSLSDKAAASGISQMFNQMFSRREPYAWARAAEVLSTRYANIHGSRSQRP